MTLSELRLLMVAVVFASGWLGGGLALRSAAATRIGSRLGHANAFASGIILGTGLLHMLPDSAATLGPLFPNYPVAYLLAGLSFLLLLLIEHVLLAQRGHQHGELAPHGQHELAGELAVHANDKPLSAYVLLAGLSVHSVLAGIALGAQPNLERTIAVMLAVVAHKSTEGFALGISLARNRVPTRVSHSLILAFAAAAPAGIAVGGVATTFLAGPHAATFEGSFSAIAAGTFVYIASLDMIGEEFSHGDQPFSKWCLACLGLLIAASLAGG